MASSIPLFSTDSVHGSSSFRARQFVQPSHTERYLDSALRYGNPRRAYAIEDEFLKYTDRNETITSRVARVGLKAIAVAQYARQHDSEVHGTKDVTYQKLGKLASSILTSAETAAKHAKSSELAYIEHRDLIGILSETAIYTLLAFDHKMEHSLTGRRRELPAHYTVPAYDIEDHGFYKIDNGDDDEGHRHGFDFKLFTANEDERVIPLQVKTSLRALGDKVYTPDITVVSLDKILPENKENETLLASLLAKDATGNYDSTSKLQINTASRNLDRLIINGGIETNRSNENVA